MSRTRRTTQVITRLVGRTQKEVLNRGIASWSHVVLVHKSFCPFDLVFRRVANRSPSTYKRAPCCAAVTYLVAPEDRVRSVQVIKNSKDSIALIEFQVMEVVGFGRREEWEVVAGVRVECGQEREAVPQPS